MTNSIVLTIQIWAEEQRFRRGPGLLRENRPVLGVLERRLDATFEPLEGKKPQGGVSHQEGTSVKRTVPLLFTHLLKGSTFTN